MTRFIEICSNNEWVANNLFSNLGLESSDRNNASDEWFAEVTRRIDELNLADVETVPSSGGRAMYHGWNGAKFPRFYSGLGSFEQFTDDEWDIVCQISCDVADEIEAKISAES